MVGWAIRTAGSAAKSPDFAVILPQFAVMALRLRVAEPAPANARIRAQSRRIDRNAERSRP